MCSSETNLIQYHQRNINHYEILTSYPLGWVKKKKEEQVLMKTEKFEPSHTANGNIKWCSHFWKTV